MTTPNSPEQRPAKPVRREVTVDLFTTLVAERDEWRAVAETSIEAADRWNAERDDARAERDALRSILRRLLADEAVVHHTCADDEGPGLLLVEHEIETTPAEDELIAELTAPFQEPLADWEIEYAHQERQERIRERLARAIWETYGFPSEWWDNEDIAIDRERCRRTARDVIAQIHVETPA